MVGKKTIAKLRLYTAKGISESNYCNKNLYCSGKCLALLSALMVIAVCHDSNVVHDSKHAWDNDHAIDFANCKVIDRANFRHRGTLESWHTAMTINADNNAKHLPEQYRFLLQ